jgi:lipid-A-disaccharide synthase-like uncharacterized protein
MIRHLNLFKSKLTKFNQLLPPSQDMLHISFSQSQTLQSLIGYIGKYIIIYDMKFILTYENTIHYDYNNINFIL